MINLIDSISSDSESSESSDSTDNGPSKWQHWDRWQGPWYNNQIEKVVVPKTGKTISIKSCDSEKLIIISYEAAMLSSTLKCMLMDLGDIGEVIPIDYKYDVLMNVINYLEYLYDNPKNEDDNEETEFELVYLKFDYKVLNDVCLLANYLDVKSLLKLCCKGLARILESIPVEEIGLRCQEMFGTANDIPIDEYKMMMEEHEKYFGDQ